MRQFFTATLFFIVSGILTLSYADWPKHDIGSNINGTILDVGDLDADSDLDVVVTAGPENRVYWFENSGNNLSWSLSIIDASLQYPIAVFIADINGDSTLDVVSGGFNSDDIVWFENGGGIPISWTRHNIDDSLDGANNVYVADIDSDNDPDVVATGNHAHDLVWYENNLPDTIWPKHFIDGNLLGALFPYVADIDGDTLLDVVATGRDADVIVWYENDGLTPPGWTEHTIDDSLAGASIVSSGDIDGDGMMDVAATGQDANVVVWYKNNLPDTNWTMHLIDDNKIRALGVELADFDNDMDLDVIAAGYGSSTTWYENNLPDSIWPPDTIYSPADGRPSGIAYIDNDSFLDVVLVAKAERKVAWFNNPGVGLVDEPGFLIHEWSLLQNYPNPFNPTTVISWQLPVGSQVNLTIYNLVGQKVAALVNEKQLAGIHSVEWDASNLTSGVYLYRLEADGIVESRKMILIK
jgi:hypothetical protein